MIQWIHDYCLFSTLVFISSFISIFLKIILYNNYWHTHKNKKITHTHEYEWMRQIKRHRHWVALHGFNNNQAAGIYGVLKCILCPTKLNHIIQCSVFVMFDKIQAMVWIFIENVLYVSNNSISGKFDTMSW